MDFQTEELIKSELDSNKRLSGYLEKPSDKKSQSSVTVSVTALC